MSVLEGQNQNQELNKKIEENNIEEKQDNPESQDKDNELLEFVDEGDPDFLKKRKKIILEIRSKIEKHPVGFYKSNIEEVFVNSDILDLAEEYGYEELFKILKNEFSHALKYDKDFDKKLNIVSIVGFEDKTKLRRPEEHKNKIEKNFEDNLELSFLTEASSRLLRKNPEVRTLDYFDNLEKSFSSFLAVNNGKINEVFRDRKIKIDHDDEKKTREIEINNDKIIFTELDFKNAKINFESENYQKLKRELKNVVNANREVALIEFSSVVEFLNGAIDNPPELGFIPRAKRKSAHKKLEQKIKETIIDINKDIKEIKEDNHKNPGYDYNNRFIKNFHFFKTSLETISKDLSTSGRSQYNSILKRFNLLLGKLAEEGKENLEAQRVDFYIGRESSGLKGSLVFPLNIDNFSDFEEFGEKISQKLLNKSFDRKELLSLVERMESGFKKMIDVFGPEDLKKYSYFKELRQRFSNYCDLSKMSNNRKKEMLARFF